MQPGRPFIGVLPPDRPTVRRFGASAKRTEARRRRSAAQRPVVARAVPVPERASEPGARAQAVHALVALVITFLVVTAGPSIIGRVTDLIG